MTRNRKLGLLAALLLLAAAVVVWRQGMSGDLVLKGYLVGLPLYLIPTLFVLWMWGVVRRLWKRRRARAGRCATCGYALTGNISGVCPECGTPVETASPAIAHAALTPRTSRPRS